YQGCARLVGAGVEVAAEPRKSRRNARPHARRVLTNARREDERIKTAQRGRERAAPKPDAVDEIVEREARLRIRACLELAYVVADPGEAFQAAFVVKKLLDLRRGHLLLVDEIEHDAGIELAGTRAHRKPVERREPHGGFNTTARGQRAH